MVKSHCILVGLTKNLPNQTLLAFQYLGFVTSSLGKTDDELGVNFNRIDVLNQSKFTNRMIWGKFGLNVNFPGQVTDDKVYHPLQKFTNKIVSDMLLREIDHAPSICVAVNVDHWINSPIESFLNNDRDQDIDNINVIFKFAIKIAAHATQIPLNVLTHGIAVRLKAKNKKTTEDTSNVMFETTL
jgi:hypothetical protein